MTPDELRNAAAVMLAAAKGKSIEFKGKSATMWLPTNEPSWNWAGNDYRIAITKPSIDWSHVHPAFVAMATDEHGESFLYTKIPTLYTLSWSAGGHSTRAENFASFTSGSFDWKDSLVLRPVADALRTALAAPAQDGWIPVSERLPESVRWLEVLVYRPTAHEMPANDPNVTIKRYSNSMGFDSGHKVTHWQPLPPPPKEST